MLDPNQICCILHEMFNLYFSLPLYLSSRWVSAQAPRSWWPPPPLVPSRSSSSHVASRGGRAGRRLSHLSGSRLVSSSSPRPQHRTVTASWTLRYFSLTRTKSPFSISAQLVVCDVIKLTCEAAPVLPWTVNSRVQINALTRLISLRKIYYWLES